MRAFAPLPTVLARWLAGLCAAAQFAKIALVLPELEQLYPEAGTLLGLLVSSVSVVGVLLGLVAGVLAGRWGSRRLLLIGCALGAVLSLWQATLPSLPVLLGTRVIEGVSHLAIVVAAPTLIASASRARWRAAAMTLWGTFFGVAFALTAWLGLPLVHTHGPAALLLLHGGLLGGVTLLLGWMLAPDKATTDTSTVRAGTATKAPTSTEAPRPLSARALLQRHATAWSSPFIAAPAVCWLFYTLTFVALLAVLPGLMPASERSVVATAMPLASIVCSMTLGVLLLRWFQAVQVVGIGFALAIAAAMLLLLNPQWPGAAISLFGVLGLVQGASFASIPELNPHPSDQALANGALAQAGNLGNAVGTPLMVWLHAISGVGALLAFVMLCYAAGIGALTVLARRRRASSRPNP